MKISYRTHPALKYQKDGLPNGFIMSEHDGNFFMQFGKKIQVIFNGMVSLFPAKTYYISKPFCDACMQNIDKIGIIVDEARANKLGDVNINEILIFNNSVNYIFYNHDSKLNIDSIHYFMFDAKTGRPMASSFNNFLSDNTIVEGDRNTYLFNRIDFILCLSMFKKYAEVEIKELKPHSKIKDIDCKYVNDTGLNITWLDSKWFTTLVKSDAFTVRGHFRLQPYKNEKHEWNRKLIWISEFEKSGYTAPARKLSLQTI